MTDLQISKQAISVRPFRGLGAEMDAYIFDETNRACGVTDADLDLIARRIRAIRPGVARMFVECAWFNPGLDGVTLAWDQPGYRNLVRQLRLLRETDTQVNLVLFSPLPKVGLDLQPAVGAMLAALERLVVGEGFAHIRWLTLWNEPDSLFCHDSPLYRRIFGEGGAAARPPWADYVRLNRLAQAKLIERGLYPQVKLLVADCTWGAQMRMERMRLSLEAFADLDVAYGFHNYNPENLDFYAGNPDFAYGGMAAESGAYRELLGPDRELMLWEFNTPGTAGFSTHFLGVGPGGEDRVSSLAGGADVADKVLAGLSSGLDGCCLWCLHDMIYMNNLHVGVMPCGLWRHKVQQWLPRPIYHYYSALMAAFRPGTRLHAVGGCPAGVRAVAGVLGGRQTLAIVNSSAIAAPLHVSWQGAATRLRIAPDTLPVSCDLPLSTFAPQPVSGGGITLELKPLELSVIRA